ncbi:MAG: hypothetical protein JF571_11040, partial [Asticcacaulis sp.]|nr:hypothetical protein [Asticcacaulis sp.]
QFSRRLGKANYVEVAGAEHEILIEAEEYRREAFHQFDSLVDDVAPRLVAYQGAGQPSAPARGLGLEETAVASDDPARDDEHLPETEVSGVHADPEAERDI